VKLRAASPGAYLLTVDVSGGPSVFFEVADWADKVLAMDPNGEDMSPVRAIRYLAHRIDGVKPRDALRLVLKGN
jgi:hypothetical protein